MKHWLSLETINLLTSIIKERLKMFYRNYNFLVYFFNFLNVLIDYFICLIVQINEMHVWISVYLFLFSRNYLPFWSTWVHPGFKWDWCSAIFVFCVMLCRSLFVLLPLAIVLSFLRFMASDWYLQTLLIPIQYTMVHCFHL